MICGGRTTQKLQLASGYLLFWRFCFREVFNFMNPKVHENSGIYIIAGILAAICEGINIVDIDCEGDVKCVIKAPYCITLNYYQ